MQWVGDSCICNLFQVSRDGDSGHDLRTYFWSHQWCQWRQFVATLKSYWSHMVKMTFIQFTGVFPHRSSPFSLFPHYLHSLIIMIITIHSNRCLPRYSLGIPSPSPNPTLPLLQLSNRFIHPEIHSQIQPVIKSQSTCVEALTLSSPLPFIFPLGYLPLINQTTVS